MEAPPRQEGTERADQLIQRPAHVHSGKRVISDPLRHKGAVDQRIDGTRQDGKHHRDQRPSIFPAQEMIVSKHFFLQANYCCGSAAKRGRTRPAASAV